MSNRNKKEYPPFSLEFFRMGYVIQYRKGDNDKTIGPLIVKEQLAYDFDPEDAQFTHVEISGGGRHSVNIAPPRSRPIDITKVHAGRYIRIIRPMCYDTDPAERKRLKIAYISGCQANLGYDKLGVLKFKIPFFFHKEKEFFCSEGCCKAIQFQFPGYLGGIAPHKAMPAHFSLSKYNWIVWEGRIP